MKAKDVELAIGNLTRAPSMPRSEWDSRLLAVLPLLEELARRSVGWKFWLRWGVEATLAAVKGYLRLRGLLP
jgi:hypothetical protein